MNQAAKSYCSKRSGFLKGKKGKKRKEKKKMKKSEFQRKIGTGRIQGLDWGE